MCAAKCDLSHVKVVAGLGWGGMLFWQKRSKEKGLRPRLIQGLINNSAVNSILNDSKGLAVI